MKLEMKGRNSTDCQVLIDDVDLKDTNIQEINVNLKVGEINPTVTITYLAEDVLVNLKGDWESLRKAEKEKINANSNDG